MYYYRVLEIVSPWLWRWTLPENFYIQTVQFKIVPTMYGPFLRITEDKEILREKKGEIRNWVHQWTYLIMWYQWTMNPLTWVINKAEICRVCLPWCVRHRGKQSQWKTKVMSSHLPYLSYIDPPLKTLSWCQSSKPGQCLLHTVTAHRSWITLKICV